MDDWDPEKEKDPEKIQAEMLEMGKEMLEQFKKDKAAKEKYDEAVAAVPPGKAFVYKRPTFEEVSARLKRSWEEVRKIDPKAPALVQVKMLEILLHSADDESGPT